MRKQVNNVLLISCFITLTNCEWYLANLTENYTAEPPFRTKTEDERPRPLGLTKNNSSDVKLQYKFSDISSDQSSSRSEVFQEKTQPMKSNLQYVSFLNETNYFRPFKINGSHSSSTISINNLNMVRRVRPKRKIIRKRCPPLTRTIGKSLVLNKTPKSRFLEVFQVVQFEQSPCVSSSGLEGTCLHEYECLGVAGSSMGTCADGYGTCCVIQFPCEGHTSASVSWFTNPGFPRTSTTRLSCTLTIQKASEDVTQIRLDFTNFELLPPTLGSCEQDQFVVSGQNINNVLPILCGINTGQHVYIEVGNTRGPINLSVQTVTEETRLFSIKVTQITWMDQLSAPQGCLQYFREPNGFLESFNYKENTAILIPKEAGYINNLNYAMCIERAPGTCSLTYTNNDVMQIPNFDTDGLPVIPPKQAGVEIFNCPTDYLLLSAIRMCGEKLNDGSVIQDFSFDAPVTDTANGPIVVWFRSDSAYVGRGFKIHYQQNSCSKSS